MNYSCDKMFRFLLVCFSLVLFFFSVNASEDDTGDILLETRDLPKSVNYINIPVPTSEGHACSYLPSERVGSYQNNKMKKILNIEGMASLGVTALKFLEYIEERTGRKIFELFDYIVGSSSGALYATLLTVPNRSSVDKSSLYSAKDLLTHPIVTSYGPPTLCQIITSCFGSRLIDTQDFMVNIMEQELGNYELKDTVIPVILSTLSQDPRNPSDVIYKVFSTTEALNDSRENYRLVDIIASALALPGLSRSYELKGRRNLDAGIAGSSALPRGIEKILQYEKCKIDDCIVVSLDSWFSLKSMDGLFRNPVHRDIGKSHFALSSLQFGNDKILFNRIIKFYYPIEITKLIHTRYLFSSTSQMRNEGIYDQVHASVRSLDFIENNSINTILQLISINHYKYAKEIDINGEIMSFFIDNIFPGVPSLFGLKREEHSEIKDGACEILSSKDSLITTMLEDPIKIVKRKYIFNKLKAKSVLEKMRSISSLKINEPVCFYGEVNNNERCTFQYVAFRVDSKSIPLEDNSKFILFTSSNVRVHDTLDIILSAAQGINKDILCEYIAHNESENYDRITIWDSSLFGKIISDEIVM